MRNTSAGRTAQHLGQPERARRHGHVHVDLAQGFHGFDAQHVQAARRALAEHRIDHDEPIIRREQRLREGDPPRAAFEQDGSGRRGACPFISRITSTPNPSSPRSTLPKPATSVRRVSARPQ